MRNQQNQTFLFFVLTSFLFLGSVTNSWAQKHEFGIIGGASGYIGDVGETSGLSSLNNTTHTAYGIFYRQNIDYFLSLRTMFMKGKYSANDLDSKEVYKLQRGLNFESNITEISAILEYNFFKFSRIKHRKAHYHTPYLFAGVGLFWFNPTSTFNGQSYNLQALGTEGQLFNEGSSYNLTQISIPFGIGYKWNVTPRLRISGEFGWRKTFTDYLDDASSNYANKGLLNQYGGAEAVYFSDPTGNGFEGGVRASKNNNDWYFFTGLVLSYNIKQKIIKCPDDF
jgi:hypothetical protein